MANPWRSFDPQMWGEPPSLLIDVVMSAWTHGIAGNQPWQSMAIDDRTGEMRRVFAELLDGGGDARARRRRLRCAATEHGEFRRAQRCAEAVVLDDFAIVCESLRVSLRACGLPSAAADEAVRELYPDCHVAKRAALRARNGAWPRSWEHDE